MATEQELIFLAGNSNPGVARSISNYLDIPLGDTLVGKFSDGETRVQIGQNVRGRDVFIFQSLCNPVNQNIMESLIMADACRRASAGRITMVAPYYGYARQERKDAPRAPITARLVADLFEAAGVNRLLTMELHTGAIQGFFNIPVDHLYAKPVFAKYFEENGFPENAVVVSPDAGGVERARAIAKLYNAPLAIVDKRRDQPNESSVMNIIGDVAGKNAIVVDDICDTAGSLTKAAGAIIAAGGKSVSAVITHPVLSGPAIDRIEASCLDKLITTDSIPLNDRAKSCKKIVVTSVAEYLGKAIRRIHNEDSVSYLFI